MEIKTKFEEGQEVICLVNAPFTEGFSVTLRSFVIGAIQITDGEISYFDESTEDWYEEHELYTTAAEACVEIAKGYDVYEETKKIREAEHA